MKRTTSDVPSGPTGPQASPDRLFEDPVIARAAEDDPLVIFFAKWWKHLLVAVVALGAAVYARDVYRQTVESSRAHASEVFAKAREHYDTFKKAETRLALAKLETKKEQNDIPVVEKQSAEALAALRQQLLILKDTLPPYTTIGHLYEGLIALDSGDFAAARSSLANFTEKDLEEVSGEERLYIEGAMLALGQGLMNKSDSAKDGAAILRKLAENGQTAHVVAAFTLARVATTDEEKNEARALLERLKQNHPEQSDLVNQELEAL